VLIAQTCKLLSPHMTRNSHSIAAESNQQMLCGGERCNVSSGCNQAMSVHQSIRACLRSNVVPLMRFCTPHAPTQDTWLPPRAASPPRRSSLTSAGPLALPRWRAAAASPSQRPSAAPGRSAAPSQRRGPAGSACKGEARVGGRAGAGVRGGGWAEGGDQAMGIGCSVAAGRDQGRCDRRWFLWTLFIFGL
jgi:hypothetical protein